MTTPDEHSSADRNTLGVVIITVLSLIVAFTAAVWIVSATSNDAVDIRDVVEQPGSSDSEKVGAQLGQPAPDVHLDMLDGTSSDLASFQGQPLVINFWSSTCAPCLAEMADFEAAHQVFDTEVSFLGVDVVDTEEAGRRTMQRSGVTYPSARDPRGEIFSAFGGTALPRTVILDKTGAVVAVHTGALTKDELTQLLRENGLVSS